ncbi:MAG TPA: recombination mediator RecR [Bacteroidia bacterium]|nr:recombination mediator RecR [Bacteroidia bacterium]
MQFPSRTLEQLVNQLSKFPGIGKKTALRMALYLLKQPDNEVREMGEVISTLKENIQYCKECGNVSDSSICEICADHRRDHTTLCIVEDLRDVIAIENTGQYTGIYHVLGGVIAPADGIGPDDLNMNNLPERIAKNGVKEIVMALNATVEGDTTVFYLGKKLRDTGVRISTLSKGISVGGELEYADELTLGRSITNRVPYQA